MAFINDDVREVVWRVKLGEKRFVPIVAVHTQSLVGGDVNRRITCVILTVLVAVDRAGAVSDDGETHQGSHDIAYLRSMPGMIVCAPADAQELSSMLEFALKHDGPVALRYPRDAAAQENVGGGGRIALGKGRVLRDGGDVCLFCLGAAVKASLAAADMLAKDAVSAAVVNARFASPLDSGLLAKFAERTGAIATVEDGVLAGGFGSAALECLESAGITARTLRIGLPAKPLPHAKRPALLKLSGLDAAGIRSRVLTFLKRKPS